MIIMNIKKKKRKPYNLKILNIINNSFFEDYNKNNIQKKKKNYFKINS